MGFTTGLLGGITLTSTILYLTVSIHQRNRHQQAILLRQQSLILKNIYEPLPPAPPTTAREARVGVVESAKDRWNGEIERLVRAAQETDWTAVGERVEGGVRALWRQARSLGAEAEAKLESAGKA